MEAPNYIYLATTTREWNNVGFAGIACTTEDDIINPVKYIRADIAELTWEDMVEIRRIMFNINKRISTFGLKMPSDEEYGKEVLSRFLESKKEEQSNA